MAEDDDRSGEITSSDVRTVLGTTRRDQRWGLTQVLGVQTVLGRTRFDLRHVRPSNPDDDVEISISCVLGTVELLVPVGTRVMLDGTTYLGGSSSDVTDLGTDGGGSRSPAVPPLDVTATVVLGRVRIHTPDRPNSNTWFSRLIDRRRSKKKVNKTKLKAGPQPAPALGPSPAAEPLVAAPLPAAEPAPVASDVAAQPPLVVAAVDLAVPPPVAAPAPVPNPAVAAGAATEPTPLARVEVVATPNPADDDVPRFVPSEPDEDALAIDDDWMKEAEAEAAEGGWTLALGGDTPVDDELGAGPDVWTNRED